MMVLHQEPGRTGLVSVAPCLDILPTKCKQAYRRTSPGIQIQSLKGKVI
jgi:hypothetical protein